ncbi:MAG TPA: TonB-dependent receptor [Candidatus Polarisedimenticolia bacterium]|nr:TonB-dependent receptor [Candidatus Polarisedimenticolia bacterium]
MGRSTRESWSGRRHGRPAGCAGALLLTLIAASSALAGEGGGAIGGRVTGAAGRTPLAAVRVALRPQAGSPASTVPASWSPAGGPDDPGGPMRDAITDAAGRYRFDDVSPGLYVLTFTGTTSAARTVSDVRVEPGSEVRVDSDLEGPPAERITVRGRRGEEEPGLSRMILGRDALNAPPAALGDPFRALAGRPGVVTDNDFKSEVRVRGGDATETAVLLDGQPLPYAHHFGGGAGSAGTLNGDLLETVELATGGFSVEHGDALAGVIDLSTREPRPGRATGSAGIGTMLAHAAVFGPAGDGTWIASGRVSDLGLYDDRVAGSGSEGVAFHDLFGAIRMPLAGGARLETSLLEAGNDYRSGLGAAGHAAMSSDSRTVRGRLELPLTPETLLRAQLADSTLGVDSTVTGGPSFDQAQRRQELSASVLRVLGATHRLNGGVGLERIAGGMSGTVSDGSQLLVSAVDFRSDRASAFAEDIWRPSGSVTLRYGARADRSSWTGEGALSPRFSLEVSAGKRLAVRCAAGRFVQFPRQEQVFNAVGETLRMQTADPFIAGIEVTAGRGTRLVVEAYRKDLRSPIGEVTNRYVDLPERLTQFDRGRALGAEIVVEHGSAGPWGWQAGYAYLEATQEKQGIESPRNADQRHALSLSGGRRIGRGWEAGAAFRFASGLPYTRALPWTDGIDYGVVLGDLNGARLPAYQRLDLRLARSIPAAWGLLGFRLDLLNVLNRQNVRSIDLSFEPTEAAFAETTFYQAPFLPVFSVSAEF